MIKTPNEAIDCLREIIDCYNFDVQTEDDLNLIIHILMKQEQEKQELKAELERYKPKFEIGQEVYFISLPANTIKSGIVKSFYYETDGELIIEAKTDDCYYNYKLGNDYLYATREEAEASRKEQE